MAIATVSPTAQERPGAITFKGNPLTLLGPKVTVGASAPDFSVVAQDLSPVTLSSSRGKTRLISVVPSLDTPVCDAQTRRFNQEASTLANVEILTISMDLPFAQKRWCGAAGVNQVKVLSDHRDASFGRAYGVLIKELRLLARAIFIVDGSDILRHVEYVPELSAHPNYDAALAATRQLASAR
ncbi:MAG: thiol peroxidase [Candidatus Omnitrophota bacterium]|nr:thiol peroxidase [Candidatus Omnitrophota bacterium]